MEESKCKSYPENWNNLMAFYKNHLYVNKYSENTISNYTSSLKTFEQYFISEIDAAGPFAASLKSSDVKEFINDLISKGSSQSNINRFVVSFNSLSQFLLEKGWNCQDICKGLKTTMVSSIKKDLLTSKDINRILRSIEEIGRKNKYRDKTIFHMLLYCGLRVNELVELSFGDLSLAKDNESISIICREDELRSRIVPMEKRVLKSIKRYIKTLSILHASDPLFKSTHRKRISGKTVQYLIKKYLCCANLEGYSAEDLRSQFGQSLFNNTGDLSLVKELMGHKNIMNSAIYTK